MTIKTYKNDFVYSLRQDTNYLITNMSVLYIDNAHTQETNRVLDTLISTLKLSTELSKPENIIELTNIAREKLYTLEIEEAQEVRTKKGFFKFLLLAFGNTGHFFIQEKEIDYDIYGLEPEYFYLANAECRIANDMIKNTLNLKELELVDLVESDVNKNEFLTKETRRTINNYITTL